MLQKRLIVCLVVKEGWVVQSINFRRYLPVGCPEIAVEFLARWNVDEIVMLDITATRVNQRPDTDLVSRVSKKCFVPLTVGGGIRCVSDIKDLTHAGADKVSINSEALNNPTLIENAAAVFGRQCIVVSIDVRRRVNGDYEVFGDGGRMPTGLHPVQWARQVEALGCGEIFLTSIERDGSKLGYDIELLRMVTEAVNVPVIACGGVGQMEHFVKGFQEGKVSAVAAANIFHFLEHSVIVAKAYLRRHGIGVRLSMPPTYAEFAFDDRGRIAKKAEFVFNEVW